MAIFTITNFDQVNTTKSSNTFYNSGVWESLSYSDSFNDSLIQPDRWSIVSGSNVENASFLRQLATASTTILQLNPPITLNTDFTVNLDITSLGTDNSTYVHLSGGNTDIKIGILNIGGTNNFWFESIEDVNGIPILRKSVTTLCATTTPTIRIIRSLSSIYMFVGATLIASDSTFSTGLDSILTLETNSDTILAQSDWLDITFTEPYSTTSYWTSPLLDGAEAVFWQTITLDTTVIPSNLRVFLRFRTTDDATPGELDYSKRAVVEFLGSPPTLDLSNLVPIRRYYQFDIVANPYSITPLETLTKTEYFTGNGINDTFTISAVPLDQRVSLYEQGLSQNSSEYVLDGDTIIFTPVPVSDTRITVQYLLPKV